MPFQVGWSRRASLDLAGIEVFIASDDPAAARREIAGILAKIDRLAAFPKLGAVYRVVLGREYRSLLSGNYRIVYPIRSDLSSVDIVTIRHGAQDEPGLT
jgi:plasmid stabilization system protein ParE